MVFIFNKVSCLLVIWTNKNNPLVDAVTVGAEAYTQEPDLLHE